jgi:hypothetical protein
MKGKPPVESLIAHFERYLSYYEAKPPFAKPEQLRTHKKTIDLRRQLGTASAALADDRFLDSLAETLKAWGIGSHDAILVKTHEFRRQLRNQAEEITALDGILIDNADTSTGDRLWRIIRSLDIVLGRRALKPTQSKIVGGSKALHHILPELMPPIDRTYTAWFLLRIEAQHFQNYSQEAETFRVAFESFRAIAKGANPVQYVSRYEWNTSRTKVIDNAIVGFVSGLRDKVKKELMIRCRDDSASSFSSTSGTGHTNRNQRKEAWTFKI